jgi:hypothetical protein
MVGTMECAAFLSGYSEYRDGLLPAGEVEAFGVHASTCRSCGRYDRVVRRASEELALLPEVEPSEDFMARLQHRIYTVDAERATTARTGGTSSMLVLSLVALLGIAAWGPLMGPRPALIVLPPVAALAPEARVEVPLLYRTGPFLTAGNDESGPVPSQARPGTVFFRYSPLGSEALYTTVATGEP